jgi:hypothetical protein
MTMSNKVIMMNNQITKENVKYLRKIPDVDKENPSVELYCSEYRNQNCIPHSTNAKSYVFHGDTLFLESYPYSIELTKSKYEGFGFEFEKCRFSEAHEGTLLRVFNIEGKWYTSTNRRLDAFNSKWAAKTTTFGLHFADTVRENIRSVTDDEYFEDEDESLEERKKNAKEYLNAIYDKNLDKSKKYMFLLEPCKEERIVCLTGSPRFLNIGVFDKDNKLSFNEDVIMDGFKVPRPREHVFKDVQEMFSALDSVDINHIQGFIAIQENKHFKFLNDRYKYLFNVRGNVSSIRFRFLELNCQNTVINLRNRTNQQTTAQIGNMLEDFCHLYNFNPQPLLNYIWTTVVVDLFNKYKKRYIDKTEPSDSTITSKQDRMLKEIHNRYNESVRHGNRIITDKNRISDILAIQKPSDLNQLIGEYEKIDKNAKREIAA